MTKEHALRDCPNCDGTGHYPLDHEHPLFELGPVAMYDVPPCEADGCEYDNGEGFGARCEACKGHGYHEDQDSLPDCKDCDGLGVIPCEACDGTGERPDHCGQCHEPIASLHYFEVSCYLGDGELYCPTCALELYQCKACKGEERVPHKGVTDRGRVCSTVPGSCSCCGANPRERGRGAWNPWGEGPPQNFDWYVYDARRIDEDGIYFARLCGDVDGKGCLSDVEPAAADQHEGAQALADILGDDTDGAQSMIEDLC